MNAGRVAGVALTAGLVALGVSAAASPRMPAAHAAACASTATARSASAATIVHVPSHLPAHPPLVIAFHGLNESPQQFAAFTRLTRQADRDHFVVAFPDARNVRRGWQLHAAVGSSDVARTSALIGRLVAAGCADPRRTYLTGFSNGAGFAARVACRLASRVAAVAAVAGSYRVTDRCPARGPRVALLEVHGRDRFTASVPRLLDMWRARDRCGAAERTLHPRSTVAIHRWRGCPVEQVSLTRTAHTWPGGTRPPLDHSGYDASAQVWRFLRSFRRCGAGLCRTSG